MVIIIMLSIKHQSVGGNNNAGEIKRYIILKLKILQNVC